MFGFRSRAHAVGVSWIGVLKDVQLLVQPGTA